MSLYVDIRKTFGDFDLRIYFETKNGLTSLLGASGTGKSLTLKMIAGILTPDEGRIVLNGRVLFDSEKRINVKIQDRNVGYVFQDYALFPNMSVRQNIMMGMKKYPRDYNRKEEFETIVKSFGLEKILDHKIQQISGGQKQRVALARLIVNKPEIILFDEPFSALDEHLRTRLQMEVKELLMKLNKEAIIVTHNRDEAYMLSNQTVIIHNGKVVESGDTKEIFKKPSFLHSAIITGCKNYTRCSSNGKAINVPDWGISLNIKADSSINYIGVRAHAFSPIEDENSFEVKIIDVVEQPFENLVRFKYAKQNDNQYLYWLTPKQKIDYSKIKKLGVKSKDILLLK